jgi:hypothetical protein
MSHSYDCPQCGEPTETLHEGYCAECCADNQSALDLHNAQHDDWQTLTDQQRDARIRDAVRFACPPACLDCHDAGSKKAPPFAQLLHTVHLVGGVNNAYVTTYKSDCMHCHKLNTQTGEWKMPSGPEK